MREKSVGAEETFDVDVTEPAVVRRELLRLSRRTASALRSSGYTTRTIVVKLRKADFTTITRSRTLPEPTSETQRIYSTACALYASSGLSGQARLRLSACARPDWCGLRPLRLSSRSATAGASWREAESALDQITGRFGPDAVRPATLVDRGHRRSVRTAVRRVMPAGA